MRYLRTFIVLCSMIAISHGFAQATGSGEVAEKNIPIQVTEVAPGLYFQYHHQESNNAWLVTSDGVLVIDARQHPQRAEELLAAIRKTTDQPIRWVINTHAHGDHYFGNSVFKREGAIFIAHQDTLGMMQQHFDSEMNRRQGYFRQMKLDPSLVKLVLPDISFDRSLTLNLGGRVVELLYLGPGQNPGDTFVRFPKEKVIFAGGPFSKASWPNPSFTPSITKWVEILRSIAVMDIDIYLGGHGDIGIKEDVIKEAKMLEDFDYEMRSAYAKGMSKEEMVRELKFSAYRDIRNYYRMNLFISSYHHLLKTGKPENAYP